MKMPYSPSTLAMMADVYSAHGVVHLPRLIGADRVAPLTSEIDRLAARADVPDAQSVVTYGRGEGRTTIRWASRQSDELLWIALTAATRDSSTLQCTDGSHLDPLQCPATGLPIDPAVAGYAVLPDVTARIRDGRMRALSWDVVPGDALLIHPYTLHGADGNVGAVGQRVSFTTRWAGDDVVWNPDLYSMGVPGITFGEVDRGTRPQGELFPRVWPA